MIRRHAIIAVIVAVMLAAGCDDPYGDVRRDRERPADGPRAGGTLRVALQAEGSRLDPHQVTDAGAMRLIENMYSTLMRYAPDYPQIESDLVADYEVSEDYTHFVIRIREDAYFGVSGRNVTAEDVVFSIERIDAQGLRNEPLQAMRRIEATGEHELELVFDEPMVPLMQYMAHPMWAIVDRELVQRHEGNIDRVDAGSGPFRLASWQRGQRMVLERDERYYEPGLPRLERVVFRPIPDETARLVALSNADVDLVLDVPAGDIGRLERTGHVTVQSMPGTFWEYVGLNTREAPLDDARVRQAIAWAIDREVLNEAVRFGHATALKGGHIPPHHWAHAELEVYPQRDVERARALLREAGYEQGVQGLELIVGSHNRAQVQAAGMVRQMLAEAGIEVRVQALESTLFFDRLGRDDFQMTLVGWVGFFDPDEWLYPVFHSQGEYNQQGYANPELDALLERGRGIAEQDARQEVYARAQRIVAEDAPVVFLYLNEQTSAFLNDVWDFEVHPTATTISLRRAWLDR